MRFRLSLIYLTYSLGMLVSAAFAQNRLEGNLVQSENGYSVIAKIWVESPDKIKIEAGQVTVLGMGDRTQVFDGATKRLRVYDWNIARQWTRGASIEFGGPANFALFGAPAGTVRDSGAVQVVRDKALFGGGGKNSYYAAYKTPITRYPVNTEVSKTARIERDSSGIEIRRYALTFEGELPKSATLDEVKWSYALQPREGVYGADFWKIAAAQGAVPEAQDLKSARSYASDPFNRAVAIWKGTGDLRNALEIMNEAREQSPRATAPLLAKFEIEMQLRDDEGATQTLSAIENLDIERAQIELRRFQLLNFQRDYTGARKAIEAACAAAPNDWGLRLQSARYARADGDVPAFRSRLLEILKAEDALYEARILAANDMAQYAVPSEFEAVKASIVGTTEPEKLAKALLTLRENQDSNEVFTSMAAQTIFALGLERAGRDESAKVLWEGLSKVQDRLIANRAFAHLMVLAARRGDVPASTNALRAIKIDSQLESDNARNAFFDAWQKSFRRLNLDKTLESRFNATNSTEEDARLFASYESAYDGIEEQERVYDGGFSRYNSPFWAGKMAEFQAAKALKLMVVDPVESARRDVLYTRVFANLDLAIKATPEQPFYRMQKVLATSQRIANLGISDAGRSIAERDSARKEIAALLTAFPGDPDAKLTAAVGSLSFDGTAGARQAIELATSALESDPNDGERLTLIFAARQTIASANEKLKRPREASEQFALLIDGARDANEQAQLGGAYLDFLERTGGAPAAPVVAAPEEVAPDGVAGEDEPTNNAPIMARVVALLANEKWSFESSKLLLDAMSRRALISPLRSEIMRDLRENGGSATNLAWATMAYYRLESAKVALSRPNAPASADAELERSQRELSGALGAVTQLANSDEKIMAARASAFIAERGGLSPEDGLKYLRRAATLEPRDLSLQLSLLESLGTGATNAQEAKKLREKIVVSFDLDVEASRQLGLLSWLQKDDALARLLSEESYNVASRSPETSANQFQRNAFSWARVAASSPQTSSRSTEIYNNLATEQWGLIDRAAALLAQRQRFAENGGDAARTEEKIKALSLDLETLERAADFLVQVEN